MTQITITTNTIQLIMNVHGVFDDEFTVVQICSALFSTPAVFLCLFRYAISCFVVTGVSNDSASLFSKPVAAATMLGVYLYLWELVTSLLLFSLVIELLCLSVVFISDPNFNVFARSLCRSSYLVFCCCDYSVATKCVIALGASS